MALLEWHGEHDANIILENSLEKRSIYFMIYNKFFIEFVLDFMIYNKFLLNLFLFALEEISFFC